MYGCRWALILILLRCLLFSAQGIPQKRSWPDRIKFPLVPVVEHIKRGLLLPSIALSPPPFSPLTVVAQMTRLSLLAAYTHVIVIIILLRASFRVAGIL